MTTLLNLVEGQQKNSGTVPSPSSQGPNLESCSCQSDEENCSNCSSSLIKNSNQIIISIFPNGSDMHGALLNFRPEDNFRTFLQRSSRKLWGNDNGKRFFSFSGKEITTLTDLTSIAYVFLSQGEDFRQVSWEKQEEALQKKRFACPYPDCMKTFGRKYDMDVHFRRHTNQKPYKCEIPGCEKRFSRISTLHVHERTVHQIQTDSASDSKPPKSENKSRRKNSTSSSSSSSSTSSSPPNKETSILIEKPALPPDNTTVSADDLPFADSPFSLLESAVKEIFENQTNSADLSQQAGTVGKANSSRKRKSDRIQKDTCGSCNPFSSNHKHHHHHKPGCAHLQIQHNGHTDFLYNSFLFSLTDDWIQHGIEDSALYPDICAQFCTLGHPIDHIHSDNCGHQPVLHGNHIDYIVDGQLHHVHGNHCDNHGLLRVETTTCEDCPNCQMFSSSGEE